MRWRWMPAVALLASTGCGASSAELKALAEENAQLRAQLAQKQRPPTGVATAEPPAVDAPGAEGQPREPGRTIERRAWKNDPIGTLFVPWGKSAKLGWADLRVVSVRDCGDELVGIQLEVKNRADRVLYPREMERALRLVVGDEERGHRLMFNGQCRSTADKLEHGAAGRMWITFPGTPAEAERARMSLDEPHGLARHHLTFALRKGVEPDKEAGPAAVSRPAPLAERIGEPAETRYYRVTALKKVVCRGADEDGNAKMAVEVLVENFSNLPLTPTRSADFRDAEGRVFSQGYLPLRGPCAPLITETPIAPGEKRRGFISMVAVPAKARDLEMRYYLRGIGFKRVEVALPVGAVPKPPPAPTPPATPPAELAPATWVPPASRAAATQGVAVTVTNLQPCQKEKKDGKMWLGVEVLAHNQGKTTVRLAASARVSDAKSYHYERSWSSPRVGCAPDLPPELAPGQKARGWLSVFEVPVDASDLKLVLDVFRAQPKQRGWPRGKKTTLILPVGALKD